ncbi:GTP cyclohydrolase II [Metabacillus sediminilitoris]|uniref:GTP cyclohydrolase II n=1 Tax=Metabacillus sediminilitoris TaxID=2567941 RepID=A0A4S4BL01_9BACI|nr:GTP cyclohydrolase II [Metabacillus sediminilitoris]QGQ44057.1 GTP cyclohydrolase II RibA [Metabacillus sediminilitoris]THF75429.1 GTP cyclohydrolase II [Metabacillus sediminilitoris]
MIIETTNNISSKIINEKIQMVPYKEGKTYIIGPINLPVQLEGKTVFFKWYCWLDVKDVEGIQSGNQIEELIKNLPNANLAHSQQSSVLVYGDFEHADNALIRMHSICHTGDIFGSKRCDCGFQLKQSMKMISEHGAGALFYLANHEGRGIGLFSKALAYLLQEEGLDTVEANEHLGFADDSRSYDEAIRVLQTLRQLPVTLITNNPNKLKALQDSGANVADRIPLWGDISDYNKHYLKTKMEKAGHFRGGYPIE